MPTYYFYQTTVPLMKVGTLSVTRAYSTPKTNFFMTGYQKGVQLVKSGNRENICSQKWSHLTRKMRELHYIWLQSLK